jgi:hypothetical protein
MSVLLNKGFLLFLCLDTVVVTVVTAVDVVTSFSVDFFKVVTLAIDKLVHISGKRVNLESILERVELG